MRIIWGCKGVWEGVVAFSRCNSPQRVLKYVRKVCQLLDRCDGHGAM